MRDQRRSKGNNIDEDDVGQTLTNLDLGATRLTGDQIHEGNNAKTMVERWQNNGPDCTKI